MMMTTVILIIVILLIIAIVVVGNFYLSDISEYTSEDRYFDGNKVQTLPAKLAYRSLLESWLTTLANKQ